MQLLRAGLLHACAGFCPETKAVIVQSTKEEVTRRKAFEDVIRRPYFHVKPLDAAQLAAWSAFLDYMQAKGDEAETRHLFERCLVACARYTGGFSLMQQRSDVSPLQYLPGRHGEEDLHVSPLQALPNCLCIRKQRPSTSQRSHRIIERLICLPGSCHLRHLSSQEFNGA